MTSSIMTSSAIKVRKLFSAKKTVAVLLAVSTLGLAAAPAEAGHRNRNLGIGAAALGGGLLLGALIASNESRAGFVRECWIEKRKRYDADGFRYYVKVRVCD